jgi:Protein of unknown function (DUF2283)
MREIELTLRYDPDVNAASLRFAPSPGRDNGSNQFHRPPVGEDAEPMPDLRLRFDDEGRLYNIEFLAPDRQLPTQVMDRLREAPDVPWGR